MNIRTLIHVSFLLPLALVIALQGCGGGGGSNDDPEDPQDNVITDPDDPNDQDDPNDPNDPNDTNDPDPDNNTTDATLSSSIWITANCYSRDGSTWKSLYEFNSDGEVRHGNVFYSDTSCTSPNLTIMPENLAGTYQVLDSRTLPDGTSGYGFSYTQEGQTYDGFFSVSDNNGLCFGTNLSFWSQGQLLDPDVTSPSVDYEHCLAVHSQADPNPNPDPDPNPNPNPNPDTGSNLLTGKWLNARTCIAMNDGSYALAAFQFTEDNRLLFSTAPYEDSTCQGNSTTTGYYEYNPPRTYIDQGPTTLPDGTQGYGLQISDGNETVTGYFTMGPENTLCVSYIFGFTALEASDSTDIDYSNCLANIP